MSGATFVFSNLAMSLDGKIAPADRKYLALGTAEDLRRMSALRKRADAVLWGASSLRAFRGPAIVDRKKGEAGSRRQPANVILSSLLEGISPRWPFFEREDVRRILFVGSRAPAARIERFSKTCDIVRLQEGRGSPSCARQVVHELRSRGMRRLLVEGGGNVMWDFVREDLIDEYHVTLVPRIIGGADAPTMVEGEGFDPRGILGLELVRSKRVGHELFLTYRRPRA